MSSTLISPQVLSKSFADGYLTDADVRAFCQEAVDALEVDGARLLVIIPDGTRTMPMHLLFGLLTEMAGPRVKALDFLIAAGTHPPMSDEHLTRHVGRPVLDGRTGQSRIFNHQWDDESSFVQLGVIPAEEIAELTNGLRNESVPVKLNRLILDYDQILICGPVFPHEVAGFSGGAKYFFPGIAGPEIINFTHWLGALVTNYDIIGVAETAVRRVIHRAAEMIPRPHNLLAPVVTHHGVAGIFCGPTADAWRAASHLSAQRHIVWCEKPYNRVLAVMPEMYDDLWTGAKGMYKMEPAIADCGEVVIYAPHITEVSYVHGKLIDVIGYHCRDYFTKQWDKFRDFPGGILAHSTHLKGQGQYDAATGIETPRINVTLATGIPEERCRLINVGYLDPAKVDLNEWRAHEADGWLVVPRAGEMLYRVGKAPADMNHA